MCQNKTSLNLCLPKHLQLKLARTNEEARESSSTRETRACMGTVSEPQLATMPDTSCVANAVSEESRLDQNTSVGEAKEPLTWTLHQTLDVTPTPEAIEQAQLHSGA